jgi:hypothetical protein
MMPSKQPTKTRETRVITMFWNKSKLDDQSRTCNNIKTAQHIPETNVTTIGINGLDSRNAITLHLEV